MHILIKTHDGKHCVVNIREDIDNIFNVKLKIKEEYGWDCRRRDIYHDGIALSDNIMISSLNLTHTSSLYLGAVKEDQPIVTPPRQQQNNNNRIYNTPSNINNNNNNNQFKSNLTRKNSISDSTLNITALDLPVGNSSNSAPSSPMYRRQSNPFDELEKSVISHSQSSESIQIAYNYDIYAIKTHVEMLERRINQLLSANQHKQNDSNDNHNNQEFVNKASELQAKIQTIQDERANQNKANAYQERRLNRKLTALQTQLNEEDEKLNRLLIPFQTELNDISRKCEATSEKINDIENLTNKIGDTKEEINVLIKNIQPNANADMLNEIATLCFQSGLSSYIPAR